MSTISPCLWFDGLAEDAARFWVSLFPRSAMGAIGRYGEGMPLPAGTVMLVELTLGGRPFQAFNGGPHFTVNPSISFFAHVDTPDEATPLFAALAEGGKVLMPLDAYPWSPRFGWVQDRFGVSWQVIAARKPSPDTVVVPCFMFSDAQHGRAHEAMQRMTSLFPDSRIDGVTRYAPGEGPTDTVKHGMFTLDGQRFIATDSHVPHGFTFNEATSLSVRCRDQAEVDRLWDALGDGGTPSRCGWIADRFGIWWQLVPQRLVDLQGSPDGAARKRMFQAMMTMDKLDVAGLERAFLGS